MKRCSRCILPETYPEIIFDHNGVCNHCLNYKPIVYKGEVDLRELLASKKRESKWDCLVPLSGGRDSTYTLYNMVKKFNLRVLGYNYDNGFVEQIAKDNIKRIAGQLDVEVVYRSSKENLQRQNVSFLTRMNLKKSPGHVQSYLCSGCRNGIWGGAYAVAREYEIPFIIFGESSMEAGNFKKTLTPHFTPTTIEKVFFMLKMPKNFFQRKKISLQLNREFPLPPENGKIKQISFFDYEKWDEKKIMKVIENELNWSSKDGQNAWRFDCQIHALVNRMVYQLLGMTEKDELYSKMIREGQMTREEALDRVSIDSKEYAVEGEIINVVLDKLQLTDNEKNKIRSFIEGSPKLKNSW